MTGYMMTNHIFIMFFFLINFTWGIISKILLVGVANLGLPKALIKNLPATARDVRCQFDPWVGKIPWGRAWQLCPLLAWRIPRTEKPSGLQSIRSWKVGHNWSELRHGMWKAFAVIIYEGNCWICEYNACLMYTRILGN